MFVDSLDRRPEWIVFAFRHPEGNGRDAECFDIQRSGSRKKDATETTDA
jgi:hypothetical protein